MPETRHTYYCRRPICPGMRPSEGLIAEEEYPERRYVFEIDAMAWGKVVYSRPLAPWEITRYGLISEPID